MADFSPHAFVATLLSLTVSQSASAKGQSVFLPVAIIRHFNLITMAVSNSVLGKQILIK